MDAKPLKRRSLVVVQEQDPTKCHWSCTWSHEDTNPSNPSGVYCVFDRYIGTSGTIVDGKRTKYCLASGAEVEARWHAEK